MGSEKDGYILLQKPESGQGQGLSLLALLHGKAAVVTCVCTPAWRLFQGELEGKTGNLSGKP